jgi:hypothetical protein
LIAALGFWLWCCIDADTKLVISHKVGKRDWWTGNTFVEDVRKRVRLPVQIATDNHRPYGFSIRQHFGYEGYSYGTRNRMKNWEIIADNLSKAGWSWGFVSTMDSNRRTIWIADAHRDNGKRFIVRADEKLTAFLELESAIRSGRTPEDCVAREIWLDKLSPCW